MRPAAARRLFIFLFLVNMCSCILDVSKLGQKEILFLLSDQMEGKFYFGAASKCDINSFEAVG